MKINGRVETIILNEANNMITILATSGELSIDVFTIQLVEIYIIVEANKNNKLFKLVSFKKNYVTTRLPLRFCCLKLISITQ